MLLPSNAKVGRAGVRSSYQEVRKAGTSNEHQVENPPNQHLSKVLKGGQHIGGKNTQNIDSQVYPGRVAKNSR